MTPTILTYHHVAPVPRDHPGSNLFVAPVDFQEQMEFLKKRGVPVVSLDQIRSCLLGEASLPKRSVAITFDDGFEDNYQYAFPVLKKQGFPAAVFMIAEKVRLGTCPDQPSEEEERYLSLVQLKEMAGEGITIGSHSTTHQRLGKMALEQAEGEIIGSQKAMEDLLDVPVRWFCYPFGSFNPPIVEKVRKAGYAGAASAIRDNRVVPSQLYYLPRVMVMPNISLLHFHYYFSGLYHTIHRLKNRRRWRRYI